MKTYMSDVIHENFSKLNGEIVSSKFQKYQSVTNPPMQLIIILKGIEYNYNTGEY